MKLKREENRGDTTLIEIIIPSYITEIEDGSFEGCVNLEEITFLPDSQLESIGKNAFRNCKKLRKIILPEKVERIGVSAFRGCKSLEKVIFRNKVRHIGNDAFRDCIKLESIEIPEGVKKINCFRGCSSLEFVKIPDSVEEISDYGFDSCANLDIMSGSISKQNNIRRIGNFAFNRCSNLKVRFRLFEILFPNLLSIGNFAFSRCHSLEIIDIPIAVHTIGNNCFTGCHGLVFINLPLRLKKISICCFSGCKSLNYIQIPDEVEEIEMNAFSGCSSIESIEIPDTVEVIGKRAFSGCELLKNALLSENLRSVNVGLFAGCFELESVYLGPHIQAIHRYAFYQCKLRNITYDDTDEIVIPDKIGFIGQSAFYGCGMKKLVVGSKIIIEDYSFSSCQNLKSASIEEKTVLLGNYIFVLCKNLRFLIIGSHVQMSGINIFDSTVKFVSIGAHVGNPHNYFANNQNRVGTFKSLKKYNKMNFTSCPISRDDFEDSTEVVMTSCGHFFSMESIKMCIDARCPMCREVY